MNKIALVAIGIPLLAFILRLITQAQPATKLTPLYRDGLIKDGWKLESVPGHEIMVVQK